MKFFSGKIRKKQVYLLIAIVIVVGIFSLWGISGHNLCRAQTSLPPSAPGSSYTPSQGVTDLKNAATSPMSVFKGALIAFFGFLVQITIWIIGTLILIVTKIIISVSQYNNFINEQAIVTAWSIIRDFCNMLFILALLVIAFATILRLESYNMKKMLPKLLIMAVLINFSRTICGIIIDAAQVFMLTFIGAIGTSGGNYVSLLGIQTWLNMVTDGSSASQFTPSDYSLSIIGGMIAAIVLMFIALAVFCAMLAMLLMRIVMLWIYTVLSPLAFILAAFPGATSYASRYWRDLIKEVIVGPVLAFFIWLSLIATQGATIIGDININGGGTTGACFGPNKALCPDIFLHFVVAIGMLIGGMMITQQIGGYAAGVAGKVYNKTKSGSAGFGKTLGNWTGRQLDVLQMKAQKKVVQDWMNVPTYQPKTLNPRLIKQGWDAQRKDIMSKYETRVLGGSAWHDTFDKYIRLSQYAGIKKSDKRMAADKGEAEKLAFKNTKIQSRLNNMNNAKDLDKAGWEKRNAQISEMTLKKEDLIEEYMKKGGYTDHACSRQRS